MRVPPLRSVLIGLLCAFAAAVPPSQAADSQQRFAMKGAGMVPCQLFVAEREKGSDAYYLMGGWVEGYLSAYNQMTPGVYDVLSFESTELLLKVIDGHCRSHPQDPLYGVVSAMLTELTPGALTEESTRVDIREGDRRVILYRTTIGRIQSALVELGLYHGVVDGRFTDETRAALIAFQSDIGFETSGFPDQATLWKLLR